MQFAGVFSVHVLASGQLKLIKCSTHQQDSSVFKQASKQALDPKDVALRVSELEFWQNGTDPAARNAPLNVLNFESPEEHAGDGFGQRYDVRS